MYFELGDQFRKARRLFGLRPARSLQIARVSGDRLLRLFPLGNVARRSVDDLLARQRHGVPLQPSIRAIFCPITVLEREHPVAAAESLRHGRRRVAVVRMHELYVGAREQFFCGVTEDTLPRGIQPLEIAVEPGHTQ